MLRLDQLVFHKVGQVRQVVGLDIADGLAPAPEQLAAALVKVADAFIRKAQVAIRVGSVFDVAHEHIRHPEQLQLFLDVAQIVLAVDQVQIFLFHGVTLLIRLINQLETASPQRSSSRNRLLPMGVMRVYAPL